MAQLGSVMEQQMVCGCRSQAGWDVTGVGLERQELHRTVVSAVLKALGRFLENETIVDMTSDGRNFGYAPKKTW